MKPLAVLQADMINGAKLLRWDGTDRRTRTGLLCRRHVAVPGNPLDNISVMEHVCFVMKGGAIVRQ
jgi:hypothetical protein